MNQGVHSEFHKSFQQAAQFNKTELTVGCFAIVICLHIFEATHIGPHIFTQYETTKLRTYLLSLLVKDRNARYYGIWSIFDYLTAPMLSLLPPQGVLPRFPLGGVELPQTIKLFAGGSFVGKISFKPARYYKKLFYGNLFDSSSSEDEDDPEIASVTAKNLQMTTNILHNIVRQAMMVIAQVTAMKTPEPPSSYQHGN